MSQAPTLTTFTFNVFGGDIENPQTHVVRSIGRDVQKAEQYFAAHNWGKTESRPMTSAALVSYFAMLREGTYSGTFESFENWYLSIEPEAPVTNVPIDAERGPA